MSHVIEKWLLNSIGVNIPVTSDILGEACFDGTLIAKILHKYNVCSHEYTKLIWRTEKYEVAYSNFKKLCIWFKLLGIHYDDNFLSQIASKKGTAALRLLYELFIRLENKEKLKYLDWRAKERILTESTGLFKVQRALEAMPELEDQDEKKYLKYYSLEGNKVLQMNSKREKRALEKRIEECEKRRASLRRKSMPFRIKATPSYKGSPDVFDFEKLTKKLNENFKTLCDGEELIDCRLNTYASLLKVKRREREAREATMGNVGRLAVDNTWRKLLMQSDVEERDALAKKLLKQSEYEKQMVYRLKRCRYRYKRFIENKKKLTDLEQKTGTNSFNFKEPFKDNATNFLEKARLLQLHNRLFKKKQKERYAIEYAFCTDIVNDIVNLALLNREYREKYGEEPPKNTIIDWKVFFLTGLPLFKEEKDEEKATDDEEIIIDAAEETLGDLDFYRYMHLLGPWNLKNFPSLNEPYFERLDSIGYIVHKILDQRYSYNLAFSVPADLPNHKVRVLLRTINNTFITEKLGELLKKTRIAIIDLNSATSYVVGAYKNTYFKRDSVKIVPQSSQGSRFPKQGRMSNRAKRKSLLKERIAVRDSDPDLRSRTNTVATQCPEPEESCESDVAQSTISSAASLGRVVTEYLESGHPLPDVLACRVLVEHIRSLNDVEGWVLVDFPQNLVQVAILEYMFTGREPPFAKAFDCNMWFEIKKELKDLGLPDYPKIDEFNNFLNKSSADQNNRCIIDPEDQEKLRHPSVQDIILWKRSELVPKPYRDPPLPFFKSFFTKVIHAECVGSAFSEQLSNLKLKTAEEEFDYFSTNLGGNVDDFYFSLGIGLLFSYANMNPLTLIKLASFILNVPDIEGQVAWDNAIDLFGFDNLIHFKPKRRDGQDDATVRERTIVCDLLAGPQYEQPDLETITLQVYDDEKIEESSQNKLYKDTFKFFNVEPGSSLTDSDSVNENEFNLNELIVPKEYIAPLASVWETVEFFYKFNMKEIFNLLRTIESQVLPYRNYVLKILNKCINLHDDRSELVSSFQVMFNGIPESQLSVKLVKNELHCRKFELQSRLWTLSDLKKMLSDETLRRLKEENWLLKRSTDYMRAYGCLLQTELDRFVDTMQLVMDYINLGLTNQLSYKRLVKVIIPTFEWSKTPSFAGKSHSKDSIRVLKRDIHLKKNAIHPNLFDEPVLIYCEDFVGQEISAFLDMFDCIIETLKVRVGGYKESSKLSLEDCWETCFSRERSPIRGTIRSFKLPTDIISTLSDETNRVLFRINLISAKVSKTLKSIKDLVENAFNDFKNDIVQRYHMEMQAIEKLHDLISVAIEEEVKIQPLITLSGGTLSTDPCRLMFPCPPPPPPSRLEERTVGWRFTVAQLENLMERMKRVAPNGLKKSSLTAILQDMALTGHEVGHPYLPPNWSSLGDRLVSEQVDRWFGERSFVSWRELVLFGLDLGYPSLSEILDMKAEFRRHDPQHSELVSMELFDNTTLWFEQTHALGLPDELRRSKAKRLLSDMFRTVGNRVNYTCFLLSVARDLDPVLGLGKALAVISENLAIPHKTDLFLEAEQIRHENEKFEIVKRILDDIILSVCTIKEVTITDWTDEVNTEQATLAEILCPPFVPCTGKDLPPPPPFTTSPALRNNELFTPIWTSDVHLDNILSIFTFYLSYNAVSKDQLRELLDLRGKLINIFNEKGHGYTMKLHTLVEDNFIKHLISSCRLFHAVNITQSLSLINRNISELYEEYKFKKL